MGKNIVTRKLLPAPKLRENKLRRVEFEKPPYRPFRTAVGKNPDGLFPHPLHRNATQEGHLFLYETRGKLVHPESALGGKPDCPYNPQGVVVKGDAGYEPEYFSFRVLNPVERVYGAARGLADILQAEGKGVNGKIPLAQVRLDAISPHERNIHAQALAFPHHPPHAIFFVHEKNARGKAFREGFGELIRLIPDADVIVLADAEPEYQVSERAPDEVCVKIRSRGDNPCHGRVIHQRFGPNGHNPPSKK